MNTNSGQTGYVYIQSEPRLWTVGHYDPSGCWNPESDWPTTREAADRVHYLNGGDRPERAEAGRQAQ